MQEFLIKIIADGMVIPVVIIGAWALLMYVPRNEKYDAYCRIIMAGLTAYLFAKLIGSVYQPEFQRPFEALGVEAKASFLNNPGFPSDHILFCSAITLAVWFETRKLRITILLTILTLAVAIGRVAGLVHTPFDVIGAVLIAALGALWYFEREKPEVKTIKAPRQWSKPRKSGKV